MNQLANFESKEYPKISQGQGTSDNVNQGRNHDEQLKMTGQPYQSLQIEKINKSVLASSRNRDWRYVNNAEEFNLASSKILKSSFSHHDPNLCVCESCQCGRHLCKLERNAKPDLSKISIYKQSYNRKTPIPNEIKISGEFDKLKGTHIELNSNYKKDFDGKSGDKVQKLKPEDLLKVGGPSPQLTTYSTGFPGFKGVNQYVRPNDNIIRAEFPILSRTTYGTAFTTRSASKPKKQKIQDNLKPRDIWMGRSTYESAFHQPNPEDYSQRNRNVEKIRSNPKYRHQYETTYRNSFTKFIPTICPAKIELETKQKGVFKDSKEIFNENTDFKSLNPSFHAISTSKHSYV